MAENFSEEICDALNMIGLDIVTFQNGIEHGFLRSELGDRIADYFDEADIMPESLQKAFAVLFRFSKTV